MVRAQTTLTRSSSPNSRAMEVSARKACACIKQAAGCANTPGTRNTAIALFWVHSWRSRVTSIEQRRTSAKSIEAPQSRSVQWQNRIKLASLKGKPTGAHTYVLTLILLRVGNCVVVVRVGVLHLRTSSSDDNNCKGGKYEATHMHG